MLSSQVEKINELSTGAYSDSEKSLLLLDDKSDDYMQILNNLSLRNKLSALQMQNLDFQLKSSLSDYATTLLEDSRQLSDMSSNNIDYEKLNADNGFKRDQVYRFSSRQFDYLTFSCLPLDGNPKEVSFEWTFAGKQLKINNDQRQQLLFANKDLSLLILFVKTKTIKFNLNLLETTNNTTKTKTDQIDYPKMSISLLTLNIATISSTTNLISNSTTSSLLRPKLGDNLEMNIYNWRHKIADLLHCSAKNSLGFGPICAAQVNISAQVAHIAVAAHKLSQQQLNNTNNNNFWWLISSLDRRAVLLLAALFACCSLVFGLSVALLSRPKFGSTKANKQHKQTRDIQGGNLQSKQQQQQHKQLHCRKSQSCGSKQSSALTLLSKISFACKTKKQRTTMTTTKMRGTSSTSNVSNSSNQTNSSQSNTTSNQSDVSNQVSDDSQLTILANSNDNYDKPKWHLASSQYHDVSVQNEYDIDTSYHNNQYQYQQQSALHQLLANNKLRNDKVATGKFLFVW